MQIGIRVIRLVDSLPRKKSATVVGKQLLRSATSVGANYLAACRARFRSDFLAKLAIAIEEADESLYWLKMLLEAGFVPPSKIHNLIDEANQLVSILTASSKTPRQMPTMANQIHNSAFRILHSELFLVFIPRLLDKEYA